MEWPFNHAIDRSHTMPPHTNQEGASECVASERHSLQGITDAALSLSVKASSQLSTAASTLPWIPLSIAPAQSGILSLTKADAVTTTLGFVATSTKACLEAPEGDDNKECTEKGNLLQFAQDTVSSLCGTMTQKYYKVLDTADHGIEVWFPEQENEPCPNESESHCSPQTHCGSQRTDGIFQCQHHRERHQGGWPGRTGNCHANQTARGPESTFYFEI